MASVKKQPPSIRVKYVVVCDDVRRENNGKELIIGVYSGTIAVPQLPMTLVLCFWVQFDLLRTGVSEFEFRLLGPHDVQFFHAPVRGEFPILQPGSMTLAGIQVNVQVPGHLRLQIKHPDHEWETIREIQVEKQEIVASSTVPRELKLN